MQTQVRHCVPNAKLGTLRQSPCLRDAHIAPQENTVGPMGLPTAPNVNPDSTVNQREVPSAGRVRQERFLGETRLLLPVPAVK